MSLDLGYASLVKTVKSETDFLSSPEIRELESTVRLSDRKLFKNWEAVKDSSDPAVFDPMLEEIRVRFSYSLDLDYKKKCMVYPLISDFLGLSKGTM